MNYRPISHSLIDKFLLMESSGTTMKMAMPFGEQVDVSSDESSSSDGDDHKAESEQMSNNIAVNQVVEELVSEDAFLRRARMYQEYMQLVPIPTQTHSSIPCTSWAGLAASIKKLYGQPLHYLTNLCIKQRDQMRIGADDEVDPLEMLIHPTKAESSIWLMEEVHRRTSSPHYLAKLWLADPMYHVYIDPIFPKLQNPSK
ncbi:protein RDM1-like isoform X4 [Nicotiana tabacum]|uniref:Protein RDM1-like isoform X4 n=1 Tax=Nicotiana tabacum TaxID=4097 RepID=A0AC58UV90_TOBAC